MIFEQNASAQAISGTGALRIGTAFLVCVVNFSIIDSFKKAKFAIQNVILKSLSSFGS